MLSVFKILESQIDAILIINLDQRIERWERLKAILEQSGFKNKIYRQPASYGKHLEGYAKAPWFREKTGIRSSYWGGSAGCALSHRNAIQRAKEMGWKKILILEDDVLIKDSTLRQNCNEALLEQLSSQEKHILYLGFNGKPPYGKVIQKSADYSLWKTAGVIATHAYILPSSMYDFMLERLPNEENIWPWIARNGAIDTMYRDSISLHPSISTYLVFPHFFTQADLDSDIGVALAEHIDASCQKEPRNQSSLKGWLKRLSYPLRYFGIWLNSNKRYYRAKFTGLPNYKTKKRQMLEKMMLESPKD